MSCPGGKPQAGAYQRIINQIPPHAVYIEPFLGGGAVPQYKRPASVIAGNGGRPGPAPVKMAGAKVNPLEAREIEK